MADSICVEDSGGNHVLGGVQIPQGETVFVFPLNCIKTVNVALASNVSALWPSRLVCGGQHKRVMRRFPGLSKPILIVISATVAIHKDKPPRLDFDTPLSSVDTLSQL